MNNPTILITGASRGIGAGLVESFATKGYKVFACARKPKKSNSSVIGIPMDVASNESVKNAVKLVAKETDFLDILINNAGIFGSRDFKSLETLDHDDIRSTFETNVLGPLRVTAAFLPLLKKGKKKKLINMTSMLGSIEDNSSGGYYGYRLSKAALNMLNRNFSTDLHREGIISVATHPGWVQTDMGGKSAPLALSTCINHLTKLIESIQPSHNGTFLSYDGKEIPY